MVAGFTGTFFAQAVATGFVSLAAVTDEAGASGLYLASYFAGGLIGSVVLGQVFDRLAGPPASAALASPCCSPPRSAVGCAACPHRHTRNKLRRCSHERHHAPHHRAACCVAENPPRITLVLQGGGALGAYRAGVYEALHEAGLQPDWVIGTSIGAINGSLIAGNRPDRRLERLPPSGNGLSAAFCRPSSAACRSAAPCSPTG